MPVEITRLDRQRGSITKTPAAGIPIPARSPERLLEQARYYFDQAEDLNLRGVPELAAAFYRQAYALMNASVEGGDQSQRSPNLSTVELDPEVLQGFSVESPEQPHDPPTQSGIEEEAVGTDGKDSLGIGQPPRSVQPGPTGTGVAIPEQASGDAELPLPAPSPPPADPIKALPALLQQLNKETAAATLDQLVEWEKQGHQHAGIHHLHGMALVMLGRSKQAEPEFRQALQLDPNHFRSLVNLSGILLGSKQHQEATKLLQHALTQIPTDTVDAVPALTNLSVAHEMAGRSMEAAQLILQVQRLKPGHIRPARLLQASRTLEEMGDDPDAIELLSWLREHHEPSEEILRRLAELLERRGEFQEAALVYRQLLSAAPGVAGS